jgi:predicted transcriptional regulator
MLDSMSKSKHRRDPRVKQVQPGPRHQAPGGPTGQAQRVSRLPPPQVLERIERARVARDKAEAELAVLIDHAVSLGIGWPEIAAKLEVTRQAARQHYQRRHRDGASCQKRVA